MNLGDFAIDFLNKIHHHVKNPNVLRYLAMLGVDPDKAYGARVEEDEMAKLCEKLLDNPCICYAMHQEFRGKKSKLAFLKMYSEEQIQYVTNLDLGNSKLIACAGSGKTRSIIGRIKFMVEHKLAKRENVFSITFSRHAAHDFRTKVKDLFPDYDEFCNIKNFSTIDSLAKSILVRVKFHKSNNVEILSIALRNYLETITLADVDLVRKFKNIDHLFVDEAQDLNEVQFGAIMLFGEKFGAKIHLIGDPNQNIYHFRRSDNKYLLHFEAKQYNLTFNYRSTREIIRFSENFKTIPTPPSGGNKTGKKVILLTDTTQNIHNHLLKFIKEYTLDISNIAIICPTRGVSIKNTTGLSVFFNLFKLNNISFVQHYDESMIDRKKIATEKKLGHVNLLTYHGTKGLEFDVVFVMDFYQRLYHIDPSCEEHNDNRYLLYVATSRAKTLMYICTYLNVNSGYINHWITKVNVNDYTADMRVLIPKLVFRDIELKKIITDIAHIITEIPDYKLDEIHDMIAADESVHVYSDRKYPDYTKIDRMGDESLFGIFCKELFYLMYQLANKLKPLPNDIIEFIIKTNFVVIDNEQDCNYVKMFIKMNNMTWDYYRSSRDRLPKKFCELIDKNFDSNCELNECIICTHDFSKIIELNIKDITDTYNRYLRPENYKWDYHGIIGDFFYLILVTYAYANNHYHYINNHGIDKIDLLYTGTDLYEEIDTLVRTNYEDSDLELKVGVTYTKLAIRGEIDFIETCNKMEIITEIKCVKDISIRYYLQLLLYNFCYYYGSDKIFGNNFKIMNLLTGIEQSVTIEVNPANMFKILCIISDVSNIKFVGLNLVYDLETTGLIKHSAGSNNKPNYSATRGETYFSKGKYHVKYYPEIIEIAIKDYETGMPIIDTLVKPNVMPGSKVQSITNILPKMLKHQPNIQTVRTQLDAIFARTIRTNMISFNGAIFDDLISTFDKLFSKSTNCIDASKMIPLHLANDDKLNGKSLEAIYKNVVGLKYNAHRAGEDVDALIKIMKKLNIII